MSDKRNGIGTTEKKPLRLWYATPAPDDDNRATSYPTTKYSGWEVKALPIGNGYAGTTVFGIIDRERVQINENTLSTYGTTKNSGTTNMTELYIHFDHKPEDVKNYVRDLDLNTATSHVSYDYSGVHYEREYFASYPDGVTVIHLTASDKGSLSFTLEPKMPYYEYEKKTGDVKAVGDTLTLEGHLPGSNPLPDGRDSVGFNMDFETQFRVFANGGTLISENRGGKVDELDEYSNGVITVSGADSAYIIIALGTNYELRPEVFKKPNDKKLEGFAHPHEKVSKIIDAASRKSFEDLRAAHLADYISLFGRSSIDFGAEVPDIPTDRLIEEYKGGADSLYLEELIFAYGRYLHISSSRAGGLPSNLNGIWNRYHCAVCKNGYWSNINTQMNYWPSFNTNLTECFIPYLDYYEAYSEANHDEAKELLAAKGFISSENENTGPLWSLETGCTPFAAGISTGGRDGWGNTPLMAELFWDYYDFTRDKELLKKRILPALLACANFLSYVMQPTEDGLYLTFSSGSPEQSTTKPYIEYLDAHPGFVPRGAAYDQSLAYSNYLHVLEALSVLGINEEELSNEDKATLKRIRHQLDKLSPIVVGESGQIKEFREETYYGEIGEPEHRHISHLCALVQGSVITESKTPAWIDAAEVTMENRGHTRHAWADIMRVCSWARIGDGERAHFVLNRMLKNNIGDNLRSLLTGIFQVEGNLGVPAAIADMLVQSHEGFIALLPALPSAWKSGSFSGLPVRGAFEISLKWSDSHPALIEIYSAKGGPCSVKYAAIEGACITDGHGNTVKALNDGCDLVSFETKCGERYYITEIPKTATPKKPDGLKAELSAKGVHLSWNGTEGVSYNLYRANGDECGYTLIASRLLATEFLAEPIGSQSTFAVSAVSENGRESRRSHLTVTF